MTKTRDVSGARWALLRRFHIVKGGRSYLRRLRIVQTPWFGAYLHHIDMPDQDCDPHDHPWPFASLVLRGGYEETVRTVLHTGPRGLGFQRRNVWRRWSLHRMPLLSAHRITKIEPGTVTLVLVGRRSREWGFYTDDGFVPWQQYVKAGEVA